MALGHGPTVVTNGLVLALDAADRNSFDDDENLITNSNLGQQVFGSGGSGYSVSTDNTVLNPFETYGVTKIVVSSSGSGYTRQGGAVNLTAGVTYTFSCFFKNESVNLSNITNSTFGSTFGIVIQSFSPTYDAIEGYFNLVPTTSYSNGWLRKSYTFTATYSQTYYCSFSTTPISNTAGTYYLYGFQLERGSSASPYYATTATTKTRGSTLIDLSGRGNTGTLTNGPTYNSSNGGAIVFDGVDDYVTTPPSSLYQTNTITCSCWVKIIALNGLNYFLANYAGGFDGWIMNYDGSKFRVDGRINGSSYQFFTTDNSFPINNWYNVVFIRNNQNSYIFVNSILSGSYTWTVSGNYANSNNLNVGGWTSTENSNSNIAQVSIYNRALSASEIQQNFNALRGRFGI